MRKFKGRSMILATTSLKNNVPYVSKVVVVYRPKNEYLMIGCVIWLLHEFNAVPWDTGGTLDSNI
jgi:hypothetical protein